MRWSWGGTAISRDRHAGKKWQRFSSYGFASTSSVAPIVGVELDVAAAALAEAGVIQPWPIQLKTECP